MRTMRGPDATVRLGPLALAYSLGGTPVTRALGELVSGILPKPAVAAPLDVVAAVPLAGSSFGEAVAPTPTAG